MSGVGSSSARGTCETIQVLFAGVPDVLTLWFLPISPYPPFDPSRMS